MKSRNDFFFKYAQGSLSSQRKIYFKDILYDVLENIFEIGNGLSSVRGTGPDHPSLTTGANQTQTSPIIIIIIITRPKPTLFMNSYRHSILNILFVIILQDKISHLLDVW